MLKKIGIVLAALVALVLVLAAMKPSSFRVERNAVMRAKPANVFAQVNDFHKWTAWSPWEKMDPAMTRGYGGRARGKGAVYEWKGNSKVGSGRMEILESASPSKIVIQLDFLEPFECHNTAIYTFVPVTGGTEVTWAMEGPSPFMAKVMQVFISMDKMFGKDFETGLANIKAIVEK